MKIIWHIIRLLIAVVFSIAIYIGYCWYANTDYRVAGVPVLNYHQVNDIHTNPLVMTVADFEYQMKYLKDNGYHTITPDELYDYLTTQKQLPDKPILITFDDGYEDNYTQALPILKKYGHKATLFMIADSIDQPRFLSSKQLLEMQENGFTIETHTYSHRVMTGESISDVKLEIIKSRRILEKLLNKKIKYLAYPGGYNDENIQKAVAEEGIKMAFSVYPNYDKSGDNLLNLYRLPIFEGNEKFMLFNARLHLGNVSYRLNQLRMFLRQNGYVELSYYIPNI